MKITCIGAGPGGLYACILIKMRMPDAIVDVYERHKSDETFGFGVVFSDATLGKLATADPRSYAVIQDNFSHWDDIDVFFKEERWRSTGHGFCGFSRKTLLKILQDRCLELGISLHFETEIESLSGFESSDLIIAADGLNSAVRQQFPESYRPQIDHRPNHFIWLGTTLNLPAFTFYFAENDAGLWRVHAYQYEREHATFIVECTAETFERSGLAARDEQAAVHYIENLFAKQLDGHPLISNQSHWRQFPTVRCGSWSHNNIVLLGDAVHTAHYSIGSGTKLAMEDGIELAEALLAHPDIPTALKAYEATWKPQVESLQRAAQVSLEWFENVERYYKNFVGAQFAFSLLTRSLRVSHANLRLRDPAFVDQVDHDFARRAFAAADQSVPSDTPPPMFTPLRLREMVLENRIVVSSMCQYSAKEGTVDDWHLVHIGSRAIGGAGLVMTEMTDVSEAARITEGCAGLYSDKHVPAWKRVVDFVHTHSKSRIGIQLAHAGRKGSTHLPWEHRGAALSGDSAWQTLAASAVPFHQEDPPPRAMTREDMLNVLTDFVGSTKMAHQAGFDMIELHFAHGYLLSSFLSPLSNQRKDQYGGTIANRMRFPIEVFEAVRQAWPTDKPISVRISATDWAPGGLSQEDMLTLAHTLKTAGCDIIDVSTGQVVADQTPQYGRLYQTPFSEIIRLEVGIPTMAVGNISTGEDVNSVLAGGRADLCAIARAHLWDPYWTRHSAHTQGLELPWPAPYASVDRYTPRTP